MFKIQRYPVSIGELQKWVKFIWHFEVDNAIVAHKLLPMDNIDIIINNATEMTYEINAKKVEAPKTHINAIRNQHSFLYHTGKIDVWGISLYAFGSNQLKVENIIKSLISELKVNRNILKRTEIINDFINTENVTVSNFCMNYGICQKTFERYVVNITGCTPIKLRKIIKFKKVSSYLLINKHAKISDLVYDNNYTDQSYFSKEFKKFSGMSPKKFSEEKITVLENSIFI